MVLLAKDDLFFNGNFYVCIYLFVYMKKTRRQALICSSILLFPGISGCSFLSSESTSSEPKTSTQETTKEVTGATPNFRPLKLEIINMADRDVSLQITLEERPEAGSANLLYSEEKLLASGEEISLTEFRTGENIHLKIEADSAILFQEIIEPQEGYSILIRPDLEIKTEAVVE